MSNVERKFTMSSVFTDVSKMMTYKIYYGIEENHHGLPWHLGITRNSSYNEFYAMIRCGSKQKKEWKANVGFIFELTSPTGEKENLEKEEIKDFKSGEINYGFSEHIKWSELIEKYTKDDKFEVKCHVTIKKITVPFKKPLEIFDESVKRFSDVVVKVGGQDFYISKLTLAKQSPYFEAMFLGNFEEAKKSEIELKGVDPQDFQDYLELLHGKSSISDLNVERLLELADMYDTPLVIEKCTNHLMTEKSKLSRRHKIRLDARFRLENIVDQCIGECKTLKDLREVVPDEVSDFDPKVLKRVLDKIFENAPMDMKFSYYTNKNRCASDIAKYCLIGPAHNSKQMKNLVDQIWGRPKNS